MNKKIATILASLLMAGFASAQEQAAPATTVPASASAAVTASCTPGATCTKAQMKKCRHNVLTPEERHRFCEAKAKVLASNPALGKRGQKHALCDAILKEDPSMEPILNKLKKHCEQENKSMGTATHSVTSSEAAATAAPATK